MSVVRKERAARGGSRFPSAAERGGEQLQTHRARKLLPTLPRGPKPRLRIRTQWRRILRGRRSLCDALWLLGDADAGTPPAARDSPGFRG